MIGIKLEAAPGFETCDNRFTHLLGLRGLSSTVPRSYVANAASQTPGDPLSFCFRRRHLGRESPNLVSKLCSAFGRQNVPHREPSPLDLLSRLKKSGLARLDSEVSPEQFSSHCFGPRAGVVGFTPLLRPIDAIKFGGQAIAAHRSLGGIRLHSMRAQMPREFLSPFP